jgi:hypothetical protein
MFEYLDLDLIQIEKLLLNYIIIPLLSNNYHQMAFLDIAFI